MLTGFHTSTLSISKLQFLSQKIWWDQCSIHFFSSKRKEKMPTHCFYNKIQNPEYDLQNLITLYIARLSIRHVSRRFLLSNHIYLFHIFECILFLKFFYNVMLAFYTMQTWDIFIENSLSLECSVIPSSPN